jgi:DNA-binding MarR family transcriptional regulator
MEKNVSIEESNASQNEKNAASEIERMEGGTYTNTSKAIEKQIVLADNATQVLIERKDHNSDEHSLFVSDFRINDGKILSLLNQETGSNYYSFRGLMRKLNLHQQSLARALNRLQDLGLIERSDTGYKLTKNGVLVLSKGNIESLDKIRKGKEFIQLLQTYVPVNVKSKDLIRALIGKWFNNLRWTGLIESEMGCMLKWISDDGSFQINLRIMSDYIVIETNATSYKEKIEAMIGSYRIFEHITRISQKKLEGINAYMMNVNYNIQKQNN